MSTLIGRTERLTSFRERKKFDPGVALSLKYFDTISRIRSQSRHEQEMSVFSRFCQE